MSASWPIGAAGKNREPGTRRRGRSGRCHGSRTRFNCGPEVYAPEDAYLSARAERQPSRRGGSFDRPIDASADQRVSLCAYAAMTAIGRAGSFLPSVSGESRVSHERVLFALHT